MEGIQQIQSLTFWKMRLLVSLLRETKCDKIHLPAPLKLKQQVVVLHRGRLDHFSAITYSTVVAWQPHSDDETPGAGFTS